MEFEIDCDANLNSLGDNKVDESQVCGTPQATPLNLSQKSNTTHDPVYNLLQSVIAKISAETTEGNKNKRSLQPLKMRDGGFVSPVYVSLEPGTEKGNGTENEKGNGPENEKKNMQQVRTFQCVAVQTDKQLHCNMATSPIDWTCKLGPDLNTYPNICSAPCDSQSQNSKNNVDKSHQDSTEEDEKIDNRNLVRNENSSIQTYSLRSRNK